ncbi:16S rRNA (uracil(1498)-N(3))-methyltransferase [Peptoniphilus equinus]|uniref:Ribosomal RNA small subunit methyltransferase E n=1 Tax=Peptoniphilus equinus TaxID=3016343 RepID=A0ABY7QUG0_9FIRM|nr:16S rRNA (uracil(1498)-N(3))-methyltransferase [Peptoniphilus equinus]WBW50367.1 16S rRNA (uracil(1498)-N(3))-methyltransferase [Peptoniphilus equinus]
MYRFFGDVVDGVTSILSEKDSHHFKVLRIRPMEVVDCVRSDGVVEAVFLKEDDGRIYLKTVGQKTASHEAPGEVVLIQALIKNDKMEQVINSCVQVGVHSILPLIAANNVVKLEGKVDKKLKRWQTLAEVAAKQSKRDTIPEVLEPVTVADLKAFDGELVVCYENAAGTTAYDLELASQRVGLVIGPEGGFTEGEVDQLQAMGAHIITLGPRILRAETAALCGAFQLISLLERKL